MVGLRRAAIIAAHLFLMVSAPATAQDMTLVSQDESIRLDGTFLGFDGQFYRIDTEYGELTVDSSGVRCEGPACPNLTDYVAEIRVSGAAHLGRVLWPALVQSFAERSGYTVKQMLETDPRRSAIALHDEETGRKRAVLRLHQSSTDEGFADLLANEADMVLAARPIRKTELARAKGAGLGDISTGRLAQVIALDAVVPVVAPGNPVNAVSLPMIAQLLKGEISDWSQLDGPEAAITLHLPRRSTGFGQAVEDLLGVDLRAVPQGTATFYDDLSALSDAVAADPFGFGLTSLTSQGRTVPQGLIESCGFTLRARRLQIKAEDYPLSTPMFLYRPARRLPKVGRELVTFLGSEAAQSVVRRTGLVDQAPESIGLEQQGDRLMNAIRQSGEEITLPDLKEMVDTLHSRRRLTTTFRFEAGSSRLDPQSRSNVEMLAQALERGAFDGQDLLFVGFSDGQGDAAVNRKLSVERAETVVRAVQTARGDEDATSHANLSVGGFGEALPMACDDTQWGRQVNRRVEVWVSPSKPGN